MAVELEQFYRSQPRKPHIMFFSTVMDGHPLIRTTRTVFPVGTNTLSGTQAHRKDYCTAEHSHREHRTTGGTSNHRKTKRPHNRMNKPGKGYGKQLKESLC